MPIEIRNDLTPLGSSLNVQQVPLVIQFHLAEGRHVDHHSAGGNAMAPHAVPSTGDRDRQPAVSSPMEQFIKLSLGFGVIGGNWPNLDDSCCIHPTGIIHEPDWRLFTLFDILKVDPGHIQHGSGQEYRGKHEGGECCKAIPLPSPQPDEAR
jgi:hypothetical protein